MPRDDASMRLTEKLEPYTCSSIDWYSHHIPIQGSVQANENGPILDREILRDFIIIS